MFKIPQFSSIVLLLFALTACEKTPQNQQTNHNPPQISSTPAASSADEPFVKLLSTTLNNGFLLHVRQHKNIEINKKQCLADFDKNQSLNIAKQLIEKSFSAEEIAEANDFYQQPIGQKLITFNQEQALILQDVSGKTALKPANFTDDEQLQFQAFLATNVGKKIQHLVQHELQLAAAPIEQKQLEKCQISAELFN